MSNLLHFVALDRAVEDKIFDPPSELLLSDYCTEVVEDGFENERHFYEMVDFLKDHFAPELLDLVMSCGERNQPLAANLEGLRQEGWYVTVLTSEQYEAFKQGVVKALEDRPWIEQTLLPQEDTRSRLDKLRGKSAPAPKSVRLEHDDHPWTQFASSTVTGDYFLITATL